MHISIITLFVDDTDRAIEFYTKKLGWQKTMDVAMGEDSRWVTVTPEGGQASFTLTTPSPDRVPGKAGGFSGVIVQVDDVFETHRKLAALQVEFTEQPRTEPWGGWAMFKDSEGNIHGLHSPVAAGATIA